MEKKTGKEKIMECTIPIPDDVALQIKNQWPDIPRRALEAFVISGSLATLTCCPVCSMMKLGYEI